MFKRTKSDPASPTAVTPVKEGGKGRPTPKRKEAEAAAKARAKSSQAGPKGRGSSDRQARINARQAMMRGDERYLPARDKGPVKRFVRDFVDSRFSIVEMLIPLLVISLVLGWSGSTALANASSIVLMFTVLIVIIEMVLLVVRLRRQLNKRFPNESHRGTASYAVMRSMQMKFMRMPKARVKLGQALPDDYGK